MKKLICCILFLFFALSASAEVRIPEDFYINDGDVLDSDAVIAKNVLPDALRVRVVKGESRELSASLLPESTTERELIWNVWEGDSVVSIAPEKEKCTLFARNIGDAKIKVTAPGGASAIISVEVLPMKKKESEISEMLISERKTSVGQEEKVLHSIVIVLVAAGSVMLTVAAVLWLGGRKYEKR